MKPLEIRDAVAKLLADGMTPGPQHYAKSTEILKLVVPEVLDMASAVVGAHGMHMIVPYVYQLREKF